jgi:hypothetical protein
MKKLFTLIAILALAAVKGSSQETEITCPSSGCIVTKTPYETFNLQLNFANRAPNGITIDSVTAVRQSNSQDVTTSLIINAPDSPVPSVTSMTEKVVFRIKGGTVGELYTIAVRVIKTDTSEKLEGDITLRVVNLQ